MSGQLKSFLNDFVLPLESKVEGEDKALAVLSHVKSPSNAGYRMCNEL